MNCVAMYRITIYMDVYEHFKFRTSRYTEVALVIHVMLVGGRSRWSRLRRESEMRARWIEWKSIVSAGLFLNGYICLVIVFYVHEIVYF